MNRLSFELEELDAHARAIGHLCIGWSHLERVLNSLLVSLLGVPDESDVAYAITSNIRDEGRISMIRALAHIKKMDDKWFHELDCLLTRIDQEYRPQRNRFVHDSWSAAPSDNPMFSAAFKTRYRTRIYRSQSHQSAQLSTRETIKVTDDEIWTLNLYVTVSIGMLDSLITRHEYLVAIARDAGKASV